jgi:general secretion pathway protein L
MRAFLAWWFSQLAGLMPARLVRPAFLHADGLVIMPEGPLDDVETITAVLRRNGDMVPLGHFALDAPEIAALPRSQRQPVALRLPKATVLEKTVTLPIAAQSELKQALLFEMDRETPFSPDELYWQYTIAAVDRLRGQLSVRLLLIPKARLARLLSALARTGIVPRWAEIADAPAGWPQLPLGSESEQSQRRQQRFLWPAAIACAVLAVAAILTPFARQWIELAKLDREIAAAEATAGQAERLRREIDDLSRSADLVKRDLVKAGRPLEVLATLTRLLPDDTFLTEMQLRQRKLTVSGRSAGAARLIGLLATDGTLRDPVFAAPVTRIEALHTEVFTIVAEMGPSS